jgi:hypothetical protein
MEMTAQPASTSSSTVMRQSWPISASLYRISVKTAAASLDYPDRLPGTTWQRAPVAGS